MPTFASIRIYVIGAAIAICIGAFAWYTYHERSVEHTKDVAAVEKHIDAVKTADTKIVSTATTEVQKETSIYDQTNLAPAVPNVGVMCVNAVRPPVPAATTNTGGAAASADVRVPAPFDPSGQILTIGRDADAKIAALQAVIKTLQSELEAANKAHK